MTKLQKFEFNRISTTPLEQKFGQDRVKSKDINTLAKFAKTVVSIEYLYCKLDEITDVIPMRGRIFKFWANSGESRLSYIYKYCLDVASAMLAKDGF